MYHALRRKVFKNKKSFSFSFLKRLNYLTYYLIQFIANSNLNNCSTLFQDEAKLPNEEIKKKEDLYQRHAFHEYVSDLISPNR